MTTKASWKSTQPHRRILLTGLDGLHHNVTIDRRVMMSRFVFFGHLRSRWKKNNRRPSMMMMMMISLSMADSADLYCVMPIT